MGDDGWHAEPTGPQGSHVMSSMLGARALAIIPAGERDLAPGERVQIEVL
jgi:molybdopterin molybdotransferase